MEKHVLEVGKRLMEKGYRVIVVTETLPEELRTQNSKLKTTGQNSKIKKIQILRIPVGNNWFKKFRVWWWLWQHQQLIKNADIVHCHDVFFWYLPFRFLYPQRKVYTTFHGYEGNDLPTKRAIFMHKLAEKLSWGNICVGDFLTKWYGTKPSDVTYGGVEMVQNSKPNFVMQNQKSKLKIIFIGRLEEETGIMEYLKALEILKKKGFQFHLNVLGDGSQRKQAEKFCHENNLQAEFKGFIQNIDKYLEPSDFVFTSRYLGILEALAYRKIVFAVYNNVIKEDYLKMTPFAKYIIISNSAEELASKIYYFIDNPGNGTDLIQKAHFWVKTQSWDKMVEIYLNLWRKKL